MEQLTDTGTVLFSGNLSVALADRNMLQGEAGDGKAEGSEPSVKQRLAKWFEGERPRTAKVGK